jgi:hypothetical protein
MVLMASYDEPCTERVNYAGRSQGRDERKRKKKNETKRTRNTHFALTPSDPANSFVFFFTHTYTHTHTSEYDQSRLILCVIRRGQQKDEGPFDVGKQTMIAVVTPDPKVLITRLYLTLSLTIDMQHSRQGRARQCVGRKKPRQGQPAQLCP